MPFDWMVFSRQNQDMQSFYAEHAAAGSPSLQQAVGSLTLAVTDPPEPIRDQLPLGPPAPGSELLDLVVGLVSAAAGRTAHPDMPLAQAGIDSLGEAIRSPVAAHSDRYGMHSWSNGGSDRLDRTLP